MEVLINGSRGGGFRGFLEGLDVSPLSFVYDS